MRIGFTANAYVMGFILLLTVVWILNPIRGQLGDYGLLLAIFFLIGVGMSVWIKGKAQFGATGSKKRWLNVTSLALLIVAWVIPFQVFSTIDKLQQSVMRNEELIGLGLIYETREDSSDTSVAWVLVSQVAEPSKEVLLRLAPLALEASNINVPYRLRKANIFFGIAQLAQIFHLMRLRRN